MGARRIARDAGPPSIEIYRDEIDRMLALIGCPDVNALDRDYLVLPECPRAGWCLTRHPSYNF